jgi:ElaB/YqjD/DUF883 family membrane-anchored ribosome-binding protein
MMKLMDYAENIDSLLDHTNPFAIITAAHLKTKATKDIEEFRKTLEELTAQDPA